MPRTKHGLPGIYNAIPLSLNNGDGAALAIDSAGRLEVSATVGALTVDGKYSSTLPTLSDGNLNPLQLDSSGRLLVISTGTTSANATGGASTYSAQGGTSNPLLTNTPVLVSTGPHNIYGVDFVNTGAAVAYVQIFDAATAGAVTLGTTVPKVSKWVPSGGAWEEKFNNEGKMLIANGIVVAATTTATGSTAPGTGINANITYF